MRWRLGLDLGTNSLGWWALALAGEPDIIGDVTTRRPSGSLDGGVLIFDDGREPSGKGKVGDSRAVNRRLGRGIRKNRDHGKNRYDRLIRELIGFGLLPVEAKHRKDIMQLRDGKGGRPHPYDPYKLRAEAVSRTLTAHELGRCLAHLGRRRGFKSNRKEQSDEDGGKLKERIDQLKQQLDDKTLGQYLWQKRLEGLSQQNPSKVRFRDNPDFYPDRSMYEHEFDIIHKKQAAHFPDLTEEDWAALRETVLWQYPLRPVERGSCEFFHDQPRHWLDTPIAVDFRLFQEINNLRWINRSECAHPLNPEQRRAVLDKLKAVRESVKFTVLRNLKLADKTRAFPADSRFNLEGEKRKELKGHRWAAIFSADPDLAALWQQREQTDSALLDDAFEHLHSAQDDTEAWQKLSQLPGLTERVIQKLVQLPLKPATASVSLGFMREIVPVLRDQGLVYADAVKELTGPDGNPLHHSLRDDGTRWDRLPYYGEVLRGSVMGGNRKDFTPDQPEKYYGKINNPTVHVVLNQLRLLVNRLADRFGPPEEVHIELARELKLPKKKRELMEREQAANQRRNEDIRERFKDMELSARDLKKVKLWEELGKGELARKCPFTGAGIGAADLFNGTVEIEHLLPFPRSLDDSMMNLTLAKKSANALKGNRTPHEAFADNHFRKDGIIWDEVLERIKNLPGPKRQRFAPNAMEAFLRDRDFIARQLTDTAYISRAASRYMRSLKGVERIVTSPGRLTAALRGKWGLNGMPGDDNRKNRTDHRHHAVDALVVALIDASVLQGAARLSAKGADQIWRLRVPELDPVIEAAARERVARILVAHKPNHGLAGKMFKETAYGLVAEEKRDPDFPQHNLVTRKPIAGLTKKQALTIRDRCLREAVARHIADHPTKKLDSVLADFGEQHGVRSVRILVKDTSAHVIKTAPYKAYLPDSNAFCDIWRVPKGKPGKWEKGEYKWIGVYWYYSELPSIVDSPSPNLKVPAQYAANAKFITRLFKNDLIQISEGGVLQTLRIVQIRRDGMLGVSPHHDAEWPGIFKSINGLGKSGFRRLKLHPDGTVYRPKKT